MKDFAISIRYAVFANGLLLLAFAVLAVVGASHHELWLDEAHHYLFARDSYSLTELWNNMRYDGHPILWNVLLMCVTRFSSDPTLMQWLHVVIAVGAAALFIFYAPFQFLEKALFLCGYFILYEYTVISRNYALFLLFLFLALMAYDHRRYLYLGMALAGLANTHLFGLAVAGAFACKVAMDVFWNRREAPDTWMGWGAFVLFTGGVISLLQIIPPSDSWLYTHADKTSAWERMGRTSAVFWKAFVAIPDVTIYRYWNSNLLMSVSKPLCSVLSIVLFILPFFIFKRRVSTLFFFYASAIFMILFFYLADLNATRYYGPIYLVFIACCWMSRAENPEMGLTEKSIRRVTVGDDYRQFFLIVILGLQAVGGISAYVLDLGRPFSGAKYAVEYMKRNEEIRDYISTGCGSSPLSAYFQQKVYYLNVREYGSFCHFNQSDDPYNDPDRIKRETVEYVRKLGRPAYLVLHSAVPLSSTDVYIKYEQGFDQSALRNERYFVYRVEVPREGS